MEKKNWRKSSPELIALFESVAPDQPGVVAKKMFGWPARFVNGNMFTGLHEESMIMRLSEEDRNAFLKAKGASIFEPMPGRKMQEYVVAPDSMLKHPDELRTWLQRSLAYASVLPAKTAKAKTAKAKTAKPTKPRAAKTKGG
jgi:TfoX/Sxy family transcriptional regulator of competence genes